MPRGYATKAYVRREINKAEWSDVYRVSHDFQNVSVLGGNGQRFNLYDEIAGLITLNELWTDIDSGTDGEKILRCKFKIVYIRLHVRVALGEDEVTSAVSQTVRFIIFRSTNTYSEGDTSIVADVDAMPLYDNIYGDINGLWLDKWKYVRSIATDGDTTAGGQVFFDRVIRPLHSDEITLSESSATTDSEKGCVFLQVVGDDPSGTNATYFGWIEVGFKIHD